ncbi:MAG: glycosyltransferase [Selenomonadales bacterium]|nr:glycosyltransferase [Selenomonadales bacterium]
MSVAIVCDWLITYTGYERVIEQVLTAYPEADVFALVNYVPKKQRDFLMNKKITTTFIQDLPTSDATGFKKFLPLMPLAIEQLDVTSYDLVISVSQGFAKGVITGPNQMHISYVYSPLRRAWDFQFQYLRETDNNSGISGWITKLGLNYLRQWDYRSAHNVDFMVASSYFSARRMKKIYGIEPAVIYPSVNLDNYGFWADKEDFYLTVSNLVPFKHVRAIVEAFTQMPDRKLIVIGDGPELKSLKKLATENINMMGKQPFTVTREKMQKAKAFIYAAEEDRDLTLVEVQACGTPVIVYGRGGAAETIKGLDTDMPSGVFFKNQTPNSIISAVDTFEEQEINPSFCRQNAERFSGDTFRDEFVGFINSKLDEYDMLD